MDPWWDELAFGAGALLILLGFAAHRHTRSFMARCRTTQGRIADYTTEEDSDSGGNWYFAVIRFRDEANVEHEIGGPHGSQKPPDVGTVVSITYDPAYPRNAWITGSTGPWFIPWLLIVAGIAFAIGGFVVRSGV